MTVLPFTHASKRRRGRLPSLSLSLRRLALIDILPIGVQWAAAPSAEISLASPDLSLCLRCGAGALWLLLCDIAARVAWSAGSSAPTSSLRLPAQRLAPHSPILLVEVPWYSSLSSSTGPPLEVAV
jgi:hypothetical protein